jgi:pimeloyl-ACP methyl ester carboxylesterase
MIFNSLIFVVFFAIVLTLHAMPSPWRAKKVNLLIASYIFFYAAWNPPFVILLWLSTVVDWFAARGLAQADQAMEAPRLDAGVLLAYEDSYQGSSPIVFIRGWGSNHTFVCPRSSAFEMETGRTAPTLPRRARRTYPADVILPDNLFGGISPSPRTKCTPTNRWLRLNPLLFYRDDHAPIGLGLPPPITNYHENVYK